MMKFLGTVALWLLGLVCLFAGVNVNEPYLVALRGVGAATLPITSLVVLFFLTKRGYGSERGLAGRSLILLWCLPALMMLHVYVSFDVRKQDVLQTDAMPAHSLGQHFVAGYSSFDEVVPLAEKGLIAGIYITRHNIEGRTAQALKSEIAALQDRRRSAGLPPLMVAADQEGGIVSHLSPPLSSLPALATLADLSPDIRAKAAEDFGRIHGRELAELGVNQDFAPVLDLRPSVSHLRFDFNTLIGERAISGDPATVSEIGLAYVRGLDAFNVGATVKHFPGLGRVPADTHHFSAKLDTPLELLDQSDWRPFRDVLAASKAMLMVGHVTLMAVDPDRPASHSVKVIDGIIRRQWNYQGLVITDDLVMGAIYNHDVCTAVVEALNAGVDLLLVAYDGSQFYRIFACASDAFNRENLDKTVLADSERRLRRALPGDQTDAIANKAGR
ncbi:MAG: glycoside hydrolase family 3 N-terminal domain-containing protein [Bradyrhizobium sp.]